MPRDGENFKYLENQLKCLVCGHARFSRREVRLDGNTSATPSNFGPVGNVALCVICEKCGYIHWFYPTSNRD
jgi:predicted nucleic-acid-binding Zn-ribbon protein